MTDKTKLDELHDLIVLAADIVESSEDYNTHDALDYLAEALRICRVILKERKE